MESFRTGMLEITPDISCTGAIVVSRRKMFPFGSHLISEPTEVAPPIEKGGTSASERLRI